jgi:hypothetical protein
MVAKTDSVYAIVSTPEHRIRSSIMPNGGMLPSCLLCKWAERKNDLQTGVYCQHHSMMVYSAPTTFCPDLSNDSTPRISDFIQQDGIKGNDVFVWVEIQYRHPEHPSLPQYYHEYVLLAPVSTYMSWSKGEIKNHRMALYEQKREEFRAKYAESEEAC